MRRVLLLVVIATIGIAPSAAPGQAPRPLEPQGRIAYSARFWPKDWRIVDNWEIFVFEVDGGRSRNITRYPRCSESSPAWSRDGRWIAFVCGWGRSAGIWAVRDDGTGRRRIARLPARRPDGLAWSPDGRRLAIAGNGIWIVNVDGKGLRRLSRGRDSSPTWSPDSQTIAFGRVLRGVSSVHLMRADRTGHRHLVRRASGPAWSPDGSTIAFIRGDSLWLMDSDGGNQRRAIGVPRSGVESVGWSPDSRHLAFEYYGSAAARGLHIIGVDGTKPRHVLWAADPPSGYDWGPNPAS